MLNVNTEVWGSPENWNTNNATGSYLKYTPNRRTFNGMYENNLQHLNQNIDLSIAPWYINKNSVLRSIQGYYYYNDWKLDPDNPVDSERGKGLLETFKTTTPAYAPFIMSVRAESGEIFNKQANKYNAYMRDGVTLTNAHVGNRYPITNFKYDKIKLSPVVYATADDPSQGEAFSASQNNLNPTGYPQYRTTRPYIVNVGFRIFADINGTWTQISATLDLDTILYGDPNSANWYSGQSDCHLLLNPYMNDYSTATNYNNWFFEWQPNNDMLVTGLCNGSDVAKYTYYSFNSDSRDGVQCGLMPGFRFSERTEKNTGLASIMRGLPWRNVASLADYNDFIDDLKRELAYIGLPFVIEQQDISEPFGSDKVYLPVFDEHRQTTGNYLNGQDSLSLPNSQWQWIYDLDELPDPPPEHEEEGEEDFGNLHNEGKRRFIQNGLEIHCMAYSNFHQFIYALNNLNMTDPDNTQWQLDFKGSNPADYIVSAFYSFVIPPVTTATQIKLGPVDVGGIEYNYDFNSNYAGYITFGSKDIEPFYNDFRDYAPYTQIELYLPLCGTIDIDPAYFIGHSMQIDYYYDIYTMACTANIYRDNITLYKVVNGTIGAQIPMLSTNMGAYQNQIKSLQNAQTRNMFQLGSSALSLSAAIGGVIAAPATGGTSLIAAGAGLLSGASGLAKGIESRSELDYQIDHTAPSVSITGSADPQVNFCEGQLMPKIIIKRAKMISTYDDEMYAKTIGFACNINDTLGYVSGNTDTLRSGLVVCSSIDTSGISQTFDNVTIAPTAEEINMIKQAASSGIIL